jgi:dCTP deaminase
MILTGLEIKEQILIGNIIISPFDGDLINPNSYDLRLGDTLLVYDEECLDPRKQLKTKEISIPEDGYVLQPGVLYLGHTIEHTESKLFAPMLEGKSSIGRLGVSVHITAGVGDVGFSGQWTLEISVVHPVVVYPKMKICQVMFFDVTGEISEYSGKYQNQEGIIESLSYKDF